MVATLVFTNAATQVFNDFMTYEVPGIVEQLANVNDLHFFCCSFNGPDELSRRVLVVADASSPIVRVCIEAAYELFEGDIHYKVERIGTVDRSQLRTDFLPLLERAFDKLYIWRPTHDNIWDNVY